MRARNVSGYGKTFGRDVTRPTAGGRLYGGLIKGGRERHRIAGAARDQRQIVRSRRDIVTRGVTIVARGKRASRGKATGHSSKGTEKQSTICVSHDELHLFRCPY